MDSQARLLVRYRERGEVEALGMVFDQTAPRLLQLAVHLCRSLADAEDLLQATFVRAMQKASDFDASRPLLPWLCGILAGEAQNLARSNLRRQAEPLPELTDPEDGPLTAAERSEQLAALRAHVPSLRGRVVDSAGAPLANWWVRGADAEGKGGEVWATADAEGRFVLRDLRARRLRLTTSWPQGDSRRPAAELADVSVHAGEVELRVAAAQLPSGSVMGRLVDAAGLGIGGAVVSLRVQEPQRCTTTSASDGSFRLAAIPPGDYDLLVTMADAPPRRLQHLQLDAHEALALGDVDLLPTATLRLRLLRADGTPWRGLLVYPDLLGPKGERCEWTLRPVDGELQGPVEPGPLRLEFHDPDILAAPVDLELLPGETRRVQVHLTVGRSRELVFAGDGKTPIDRMDVLHLEVLDAAGAVVLLDAVRRSPHGDGNWTFERTFAFGSYRVTAHTDSGRRYAGAFAVREDLGDASRVEVGLLPD